METVRSKVGALIAYEKSGQGAPLILAHGTLPNSRIVAIPGQQHIAMNTAPDLFSKSCSVS